jgi:hypothetical protein
MPCDSSVVNEQGDIFSIEKPYTLNCNESRVFNYIDKITLLTDGTCAATKLSNPYACSNLFHNNNRLF